MSRYLTAWTVLALCAGFAACGATKPQPTEQPRLVATQLGTIERLHEIDGFYLASQPSAADFAAARRRGVVSVVNLRLPDENEFDEAAVVEGLGMRYHNPGFRGPETLTDATLDRARALLSDRAEQPMLVHCASANRVGAVWLAHRVLDDDIPLDAALAEAHAVGLSNAAHEARVRAYIAAHQSAQGPAR